jgi:CO/xanthine dehydrogenase FAD-binding subunit
MDLNTVSAVARPRSRAEFDAGLPGDAWLAGGTWLLSEPQRELRRLIDLEGLGWEPLRVSEAGLSIGATCTIATLDGLEAPAAWTAAPLIGQCCRAFLASFKIWNVATVGGNLCLSLPAGPMISLCAALEGSCLIWQPDGGERRMAAAAFSLGPVQNALRTGEVLRQIDLPWEALTRRTAFRRASLFPLGRSGVLLIGTRARAGAFSLTITAATRHPVVLRFAAIPAAAALAAAIDSAVPEALYYDDIHGKPDWRRHMTHEFAQEIRAELGS